MVERHKDPWGKVSRDVLIFGIGAIGAIHELFFTKLERPYILAFCAAMMGLTAYLRANGK